MLKNVNTFIKEQIVNEYLNDDRTPNYLSKKYNISLNSLNRFLFQKKQLPKRSSWVREDKGKTISLSKEQKGLILQQFKNGSSIYAISIDTKISYRVIQFYLYKELKLTNRDGRKYHIKPNIDNESLVNDYKTGLRLIDLQKKYNVSYTQCKKILVKNGIKIGGYIKHKSPVKDRILENINIIIKQYNDGSTIPELSKQHNCSQTTLKCIFKERNIHTRSCGEESKIRYSKIRDQWPSSELIDLYLNEFYTVCDLVEYLNNNGYSASRKSVITFLKENNIYLGGIKNGIERRENKRELNRDDSQIQEMYNYRMRCMTETEKTYRKYKHIINPQKFPRGLSTYHIDHMFSVKHGFHNNIDPKILCCPLNLQMLSALDNKRKQQNSSITKEQLFERYNTFLAQLHK